VLNSGVAPFELLAFAVILWRHRNRDFYHGLLREAGKRLPSLGHYLIRTARLPPGIFSAPFISIGAKHRRPWKLQRERRCCVGPSWL
jgi:hypothetical protein